MFLVDTSIWVLIEHGRFDLEAIAVHQQLAVCPAIVLEVLRGAGRYDIVRATVLAAKMLDAPTPLERFEEAAQLYRRCRDAGVTVRSSIDCLVAATALAHDVPVFHDDRDFENIKRVVSLRTVSPRS